MSNKNEGDPETHGGCSLIGSFALSLTAADECTARPIVGRMTNFRTVLQATGGNNVGIVVPESTVLAFNRGKRVPVVVTIDGGYTYKTTVGVMGGRYLVSFNAETRKQTGRSAGDEVEVELVVDPDR
jgi:hypothetical protein